MHCGERPEGTRVHNGLPSYQVFGRWITHSRTGHGHPDFIRYLFNAFDAARGGACGILLCIAGDIACKSHLARDGRHPNVAGAHQRVRDQASQDGTPKHCIC
jgi:hypothetical protein